MPPLKVTLKVLPSNSSTASSSFLRIFQQSPEHSSSLFREGSEPNPHLHRDMPYLRCVSYFKEYQPRPSGLNHQLGDRMYR